MANDASKEESIPHATTDDDRFDLIALLKMRFGDIPDEVTAAISSIDDFSQIDHLILVAANAVEWDEFLSEIRHPGFRIVGQAFDPLSRVMPQPERRGESNGQ